MLHLVWADTVGVWIRCRRSSRSPSAASGSACWVILTPVVLPPNAGYPRYPRNLGGTLTGWRGRGVFRALVARRAAMASDRGFRYLQVDAMPTSRPILARLGFVELAITTPYRR